MKTDHIVVIGDFAEGFALNSGQTAKVRDYHYYLSRRFGEKRVEKIDTRNCEKRAIPFMHSLLSACRRCTYIVIPLCGDGTSIKTLFPFLMTVKNLHKLKIYFPIVGGGIFDSYDSLPMLKKYMPRVDMIYAETHKLEKFLHGKGLTNVKYGPVFSRRKTLAFSELPDTTAEPFRFCTYSRVSEDKGISDAIDAIIEVNRRHNKTVCTLDVYGPPTEDYREKFAAKISEANGTVMNQPLLDDSNAIDELSKHYMMLFPTYYPGEGFPIAIVECLKAGLPVIATDWHFNSELIDQNETGYVYDPKDKDKLPDLIERFIRDPETVSGMKKKCCEKALLFEPDGILEDLYQQIESN